MYACLSIAQLSTPCFGLCIMSITAMKALGRLVQAKLRLGDNDRSAIFTLESRARELEDENANLREQLAHARAHQKVQEEAVQQLVIDNAATHLALANTASELRCAQQELRAGESKVVEAEAKVDRIRSRLVYNKTVVGKVSREVSNTKAQISQKESELSNSQAELESTQNEFKSAVGIINSHANTIHTLTPHLDFRKSLRLRCLLTYRRDRRSQSLTILEDEKIHKANSLAHGADCLFDMQHVISGPKSPYCDYYESIYGTHPKWIRMNRDNALLITVTNQIGDISMTDGIWAADPNVRNFRERGERVQKELMLKKAVSESEILALGTKHRMLLLDARNARRRAWRD